jgi:hypothetical protein
MYILRLLKYLSDLYHLCHLSRQYFDGESQRDTFLKVRHPSRNRTEAQCSGSLNLAAPVCAELVCVAALSAHVSRWACVVVVCVQSVPRKEEAVGGGHDAGQVRCFGGTRGGTEGIERAGVGRD